MAGVPPPSPVKTEIEEDISAALTPREVALAELIAKTLNVTFDQKLASIRQEMQGHVAQASQAVQQMTMMQSAIAEAKAKEAAEMTLPQVAAVAQKAAADLLQQSAAPLIHATQLAEGSAARANEAAGQAYRAASSLNQQPPREVMMRGGGAALHYEPPHLVARYSYL